MLALKSQKHAIFFKGSNCRVDARFLMFHGTELLFVLFCPKSVVISMGSSHQSEEI